jgi:hypothetical protein
MPDAVKRLYGSAKTLSISSVESGIAGGLTRYKFAVFLHQRACASGWFRDAKYGT